MAYAGVERKRFATQEVRMANASASGRQSVCFTRGMRILRLSM
jgi:hypothetical protein